MTPLLTPPAAAKLFDTSEQKNAIKRLSKALGIRCLACSDTGFTHQCSGKRRCFDMECEAEECRIACEHCGVEASGP